MGKHALGRPEHCLRLIFAALVYAREVVHHRLLVMLISSESSSAVGSCRVTKVREFQKLARSSEADGHLQQKLKQLLKLSKEKWDAACEHAKIAVQVPSKLRFLSLCACVWGWQWALCSATTEPAFCPAGVLAPRCRCMFGAHVGMNG